MSIAIVSDSTAYLTEEERKRLNVHMIPLIVNLEDGSYEEEIEISAAEFYEKVRNSKVFPKTTQPSVGRFLELYEKLSEDYDEIISIHLSSGISGTYQGALQASQMVENVKVHVYDSELSCSPQGFYVKKAAQMALDNYSSEEILTTLNNMKETIGAYFIVDDLAHLQRGGRLSAASAIIGGLLQVKPVLTMENKIIIPFEKIRSKKKALLRVEELLANAVEKHGDLEASIIHANCLEEAEEWKARLSEKFPSVDFSISYFGPVIGTHLGEGSLGLGWVKKI